MEKIRKAIDKLKKGEMIIVTDDIGRENEGDLVAIAQFSSSDTIAFMAKEGRGLICTPISQSIAKRLDLPPMVENNTDNHETAFTVSIDHVDTTTGISAFDRHHTIQSLINPIVVAQDFRRPGHIFPLVAKEKGLEIREGHTEASIELAILCQAQEVAIICEIMGDDGVMLAGESLEKYSEKHDLMMLSIVEIKHYLSKIKLEMGK